VVDVFSLRVLLAALVGWLDQRQREALKSDDKRQVRSARDYILHVTANRLTRRRRWLPVLLRTATSILTRLHDRLRPDAGGVAFCNAAIRKNRQIDVGTLDRQAEVVDAWLDVRSCVP
jgi:hypothetical protein